MLKRSDSHLPLRWLVDLRDGVLSETRETEARAHLASDCTRCTARAARLERTLAAIAAGPLPEPSRAQIRSAVAQFRRTFPDGPQSRFGRVVTRGALVFDQRVHHAAALRSSPGDERRLLWTVAQYEIDAELTVRRGGIDLLGQALAADDDPDAWVRGFVEVRRRGRAATRRSLRRDLENDGRFTFRGLRRGRYELSGELDGLAFALPALVID